ncbi:hypothetical protein CPB84DRAFT_1772199 [Gymnopilus junonius]|uniref:Methyltransferase ausD n=1 Tax=Gymnopilus junonius TaxID=109634 RepID=A0A9P5TQI9_GYMJU|nr:hypothetical protein CPB84DRAFT_1772199 [Gymnopilus junonius]
MARYYADPATKPKLDPALYSLDPDESTFFQRLTGINDHQALKDHIIAVQAKAYDIYGYPCIRRFAFTKLKIARLPAYKKALQLLQERKDPILLDIGCCFGNDLRKAVLDGWPVQNAIAPTSNRLFKSTPETFPASFIQGDVFSSKLLDLDALIDEAATPPLNSLTSLTPLRHRISAIHASAFFHLFQEDRQLELARKLAALLLPKKGSIIFGAHGSLPVKGFRTERIANSSGVSMFCHSPDSWKELWTTQIFGPDQDVKVDVQAGLVEVQRPDLLGAPVATEDVKFWLMYWSVQVL